MGSMNQAELRKEVNNLTRAANDARMLLRESAMLADCVAYAVERGEDCGFALQNLQACALGVIEAGRVAQDTSSMIFGRPAKGIGGPKKASDEPAKEIDADEVAKFVDDIAKGIVKPGRDGDDPGNPVEMAARLRFSITEQMKRDASEALSYYQLAEYLVKNGSIPKHLIPDDSPWPVWWNCRKGHKWRESVADHKRRGKCPFCVLWEKT